MVLFQLSRPRRETRDGELLWLQEVQNLRWHQGNGKCIVFAELISNKCGGLVHTVSGFIDGTLRKTCHPFNFRKLLYSGHKRAHGIKLQSVVTPDCLFASFFEPITGNRHESYMVARSELILKLQEFMPGQNEHQHIAPGEGKTIYSIYGDPAYPQSLYVFGGYRNQHPGSDQAHWNTEMSKVCEVVEWGFANLISNWSFLDFKALMMIFQSPIAKYYIVAAFQCNLRTCFYGNQIMDYFNCDTLTLDEYLSLINDY